MSKVLRTVGKVAGVVAAVALIGSGIGSALGGTMLFTAFGAAASASSIAAVAGAVSALAMAGAQATAKKPPAQGSLTQISIATNAETPCIIGRTYFGGIMRHDVGYGGKVGKVQNPYRGMVIVYSGCGPTNGLVARYADFVPVSFSGAAATGYYAGFMYADSQVGASPESSALSPQWGGMPGWGSSHKLSGKAATLWSLKFDKDGKIYTGGVPQLGEEHEGVMAYDAREDSTRPGGSGSQRLDDESTWEYSEWPDDHAVSYAYGRHVDGKKIFGLGFPEYAIDIEAFTAWGNVCRANGWKVGGIIFEPGDRMANLKRIMAAGSAEPVWAGGILSVKYDAPRVSLVTITPNDYAQAASRTRGMQTWRDRKNTFVPKYRSADHKWEYVESDAITSSTYLTEDGEEKIDTYQIDLCQDKDQAAQLTAYKLVNGREMVPIERVMKPEFRFYRPGDMVTIDDPEGGLDGVDCVILRRSIDPATFAVRWTMMSETTAKHDFALGKTGTAPPTPTLLDPADRDDVAGINTGADGAQTFATRSNSFPLVPGDGEIEVLAFTGVLANGTALSLPGETITGLDQLTRYVVFWRLSTSEYETAEDPAETEFQDNDLVFIARASTSDGVDYPDPDTPPPGWGGDGSSYDGPLP